MIRAHHTRGDNLPRHFPPGYFDRWFYIVAASNAAFVSWDTGSMWLYRDRPALLLLISGATALQFLLTARFVRGVVRDWQQWRTHDRPRLLDLYADLDRMAAEHEAALAAFEARHRDEMRK